ncbi:MAG: hypothetical protein QOH81_463 [Sphingomonadales bacterium]|nr:hypothetical protein [Sphingomonadales bacterium]
MTQPRTILLPIGDPNGIGPEVAVKAAAALHGRSDIRAVIVGDRFVVEHYAGLAGWDVRPVAMEAAAAAGALDLIEVDSLPSRAFEPGTFSSAAGRATVRYVAAAVDQVKAGRAQAIVACPHSETSINAAGIGFAGYPTLLARLLGLPADRVFLMLVGGRLRIVHATLHERLADAIARLTPELVEAAAVAAVGALVAQGIARPRIGILGINPHAGEQGLFGTDDDGITMPAADRLRSAGHDVVGPQGADLLLGRDDIDVFVAMYHDQGHVPVKLLAGRSAAALSIGAGLIFSSVGHGCAFDIAGKGLAEPEAVLRAVDLVAGHAGHAGLAEGAGAVR